jgi:hypothetical protein
LVPSEKLAQRKHLFRLPRVYLRKNSAFPPLSLLYLSRSAATPDAYLQVFVSRTTNFTQISQRHIQILSFPLQIRCSKKSTVGWFCSSSPAARVPLYSETCTLKSTSPPLTLVSPWCLLRCRVPSRRTWTTPPARPDCWLLPELLRTLPPLLLYGVAHSPLCRFPPGQLNCREGQGRYRALPSCRGWGVRELGRRKDAGGRPGARGPPAPLPLEEGGYAGRRISSATPDFAGAAGNSTAREDWGRVVC